MMSSGRNQPRMGPRIVAYVLVPALLLAYARFVEPRWICIREVHLTNEPVCRFVHISDLHHKGDRRHLRQIVDRINTLKPDFVCFTGDLVEDEQHLAEALDLLGQLQPPIYAVPGNHDPVWGPLRQRIQAMCRATGGEYLVNDIVKSSSHDVQIVGTQTAQLPDIQRESSATRILVLTHYPETAAQLPKGAFDLALAGHSHGGQVRLPLFGALILPHGVGSYERGLYQLDSGPLYVHPGLGTFVFPIRFLCRPEITVISL